MLNDENDENDVIIERRRRREHRRQLFAVQELRWTRNEIEELERELKVATTQAMADEIRIKIEILAERKRQAIGIIGAPEWLM